MSLLPVYTVISFALPYIYSILFNNLIYNRRKSKSPQFKFFLWEEWGLMTFSSPPGESQMCPSSPDSTQLSVKFGELGVIRDIAYKQPLIIPPQLRGLVSFSHSLYTLQHLYDKKVWQILFNVKATTFYTCKTTFPNSRPLSCRLQSLLVNQSAVFLLSRVSTQKYPEVVVTEIFVSKEIKFKGPWTLSKTKKKKEKKIRWHIKKRWLLSHPGVGGKDGYSNQKCSALQTQGLFFGGG